MKPLYRHYKLTKELAFKGSGPLGSGPIGPGSGYSVMPFARRKISTLGSSP